ncbi:MAG TPA: hypothetical protein P5107_00595 [Thermotogota bacterium]|nr:hypothetical protein [Thermotogota bacterium]
MKRWLSLLLFLIAVQLTFSQSFSVFPTKYFDVLYQQQYQEVAVQLVQEGNEIYQELSEFYGITLKKRLKVYLLDTVDFSNAYADIFSNVIIIYINRNSSDYYNNTYPWWVPFVFSHELTHILVANKSDWTKDILSLFGHPVSILFDTAFTPSYLHEGVSIFSESLLFPEGRLNDSRYLSYLKAEILDNGFRGLSLAGGMTSYEFSPTGFNYLYGAYLIQYIEETYGTQVLLKFINEYGSTYRFNLINMIEQISDKSFSLFLSDWHIWLQEKTALQKSSETVTAENMTNSGYYSGISSVSDNSLYYFSQMGGQQTTLIRLNKLEKNSIHLPIPTAFSVSPSDQCALIYANANGLEDYDFGLYIGHFPGPFNKVDDIHRPLSCEWMDDETLFFTFLEKGGTGLASYNIFTHEISYFLSPSPDFYINNISCYDQRLIMSITYNKNADIYELDVQSNQLDVLFQTQANEIDVFLCSEGILYACDQDGQYDIYHFNETQSTQKKLTDSHFGAFKPVFFEGQFYFRSYSGKGFDFNRLIHTANVEKTIQTNKISYSELVLKENLAVDNVLKEWKTEYTPFPIPRFGIPALFLLNNHLIGVTGFAGWDDLKEWIWYGYLGSLGEIYTWDYSIIHRGFPDFQLTWNGNQSYEELKAAFHFPFMLRNDQRNAYVETAINMGINHTSDDLSWKMITDVYLHQAYQPIVYPDNPISVPQFLQVIQLGTSGFFSQTGIGLPLPASMIGMISQRTAYSKTSLQAEAWYPMNFISSVGTSEGKFKISSPIAHFGLNIDLSKQMPFAGIIGIWYDVGIQYWLDFRLSIDLVIGDQIIPKIGIQNTLLGSI